MSTEIETKMTAHRANSFWGGETRGKCIQITAAEGLQIRDSVIEQIQEEGFIQLTMEEAAALCNTLAGWIKNEALRRQALLKEQVKRLQAAERSVFNEIAELPAELLDVPATVVDMVSMYCPRGMS